MRIAKINEQNEVVQYPYSMDAIRKEYKNISFDWKSPTCLDSIPYAFVQEVDYPVVDPVTETVTEGPPLWDGEKFVQNWIVGEKTPEEIEQYLDGKRSDVWEKIKKIRDDKWMNGGFPVGLYWFHSDIISRSQYAILARRADKVERLAEDMEAQFSVNGAPLFWKTMSGDFVPMTATLAQAIVDAAEVQEVALFSYAEELKGIVYASDQPENIPLDSGWPATFV